MCPSSEAISAVYTNGTACGAAAYFAALLHSSHVSGRPLHPNDSALAEMNTSVIRHRVADFLIRHAPFDSLPAADVLELAASGRVKFHESEEYIFEHGGSFGPLVWIVQQGQVELLDLDERLLDVKGEGDVLGIERFAGGAATPKYSARTTTDVILYGISAEQFAALIPIHPGVHQFVQAHVSVAELRGFGRTSWLDAPLPPLEFFVPGTTAAGSAITTRELMRAMVRAGAEETVIGVTAADLALFCGANPPALLRRLREARSPMQESVLLQRLQEITLAALAQPADVDDCLLLNHAATVAFAQAQMRAPLPERRHAWLLFGRAARGELPAGTPQSGGAALLALVADGDEEVHASGGSWPSGFGPVMSLSACLRAFEETIRNPLNGELYLRRTMFDCTLAGGDPTIFDEIRECVRRELREHEIAIPLLANDTLANLPPLTFFQGLVLDWDGARRDAFNIRETAISPIAGAARVFALAAGGRMDCVSTLDRLRLAETELHPGDASLFREAAEAFRAAFYFQMHAGGPIIESRKLSKLEQRLLKTMFTSIERLLEFTVAKHLSASPC